MSKLTRAYSHETMLGLAYLARDRSGRWHVECARESDGTWHSAAAALADLAGGHTGLPPEIGAELAAAVSPDLADWKQLL